MSRARNILRLRSSVARDTRESLRRWVPSPRPLAAATRSVLCAPAGSASFSGDVGSGAGETTVVFDGLGFPESTRWREGRVWLCNWGAGEVLAVAVDGECEVMARVAPQTLPLSIDWLPDGSLLVVDGPRRLLLGQHPDGALDVVADLTSFGSAPFNEIVVDEVGNTYVNGGPGMVVLVAPDGSVVQVADDLRFPNGMALLDGGQTLVVADSYAQQLVAYAVAADATLSRRRVWAELEHAPDGICVDADGAVWVASVPGRHCVRVREGGEVVKTITIDRGCFACMLGGDDGRTLFIGAAQWRGMEAAMSDGPGSTGRLVAVPAQPAPHAGRP
jgi:sugar lactone lactonase YvrE